MPAPLPRGHAVPDVPTPAGIPERRRPALILAHGLFLLVATCWITATLGAFVAEGIVVWSTGLLYVFYDSALLAFVGWQTRHLRSRPAATAAGRTRLAVLIPARNESDALARTVDAVLAQCQAGDEVWVVDDGSVDTTRQELARCYAVPVHPVLGAVASAREPRLRVLSKAHSGKADSLNRAWPLTDAEVVVTVDADTVLHPGALQAVRAAFEAEPDLAAVCGTLVPRCAPRSGARLFEAFQRFEYLRTFLARAAWQRVDALLLVSGAFAAYRHEVLARLGGYDPRSLVEDYELIHRLHRLSCQQGLNWKVRVLGNALATTDAPGNLKTFLNQRRRWFAGFLETQFANRDMVGNARYGRLGTLMLPVKTVDTLQPIFGLTAFVLLVWHLLAWTPVAPIALLVIGVKLMLDFAFHLWAIDRYHRWIGAPVPPGFWLAAIGASLAEPFSFQLIRHLGAARGWYGFLTGRLDWSPQRTSSVAAR